MTEMIEQLLGMAVEQLATSLPARRVNIEQAKGIVSRSYATFEDNPRCWTKHCEARIQTHVRPEVLRAVCVMFTLKLVRALVIAHARIKASGLKPEADARYLTLEAALRFSREFSTLARRLKTLTIATELA